jgi:predicted TIM-barrel fold metal-dependent hydrolase
VTICDAHLHFFSKGVLAFYGRQVDSLRGQSDPAAAAAALLGIEAPPAEPETLAARWVAEMDKYGVSRAALFGSAPGEHAAVSRAVRAFPDRFVPFQMINPRSADATMMERADRGLRGVLLFPALHGYYPDEDVCRPVYEAARESKLVVFVHIGKLRIVIRDKLGVRIPIDEALADPRRLGEALRGHPEVRFIVPHFGSGRLHELLNAVRGVRNLWIDTSSSNNWMAQSSEYPTLEAAFQAVLESADIGPERVVFGSDSTVFPRGWRSDVYQDQLAALEKLGASERDRQLIFKGNFETLFAD